MNKDHIRLERLDDFGGLLDGLWIPEHANRLEDSQRDGFLFPMPRIEENGLYLVFLTQGLNDLLHKNLFSSPLLIAVE